MGDQVWEYEFALWPDESHVPKAPGVRVAMTLFRTAMQGMQVQNWTEGQFNEARDGLDAMGWTMREISRRPHVETETVL